MIDRKPSGHFSSVASAYARARPTYPADLFDWLTKKSPRLQHVWDCATGNGQAAIPLAERFESVTATDVSHNQLAEASTHPRIRYRCTSAEDSGIPADSVDLVTVAQALHWFDLDRFYREVRRVVRHDGLIAVWTYGRLELVDSELNNTMQRFYDEQIAPCWPPERAHIEDQYARLAFPFQKLDAPRFDMTVQWPLSRLLDYVRSWSATPRFVARYGLDPTDQLEAMLAPQWQPADGLQTVRWPLTVKAGYVHCPG